MLSKTIPTDSACYNDSEKKYSLTYVQLCYRTERSYGFATKESCYNCGLSNHDTNECYFHFPITCRSCGREGHKSKMCKWFSEFRNHY